MRKVYLLIVLLLSAFISHAQGPFATTECSSTGFSWNNIALFPTGQYTWTAPAPVAGLTGGVANATPRNFVTGTLINLTNGPLIASYTVTEVGSGTLFTLNVTVNPKPNVTITNGNQVVLNGMSTNVVSFGSNVLVGTTFAWSNNNL